MSAKRWMGRIGLVVAGLLGGLVAAELGARVLEPQGATDLLFNAPENTPRGLYSGHSELLSVPTPGFSATQTSLGYRVDLRINSVGVRGPEVGAGPNWLAVGDSFTFSAQVPEAQGFHALLGTQGGVTVLNGGVDGYGTWQARRRYELLADQVDVDGVILVLFAGNDLIDNEQWPMRKQMAQNMPQGQPLERLQARGPGAWLNKRSYLYGRVQVWRAAKALESGMGPDRMMYEQELALFHETGAHGLRELMRPTRDELRGLRDQARQRGDTLLVAVAPPAFAVNPDKLTATFGLVGLDPAQAAVEAPEAAILDALQAEGITSCNLGPALRGAHAAGEQTYLDYDGHWTEQGHQVVAQELASCLGW